MAVYVAVADRTMFTFWPRTTCAIPLRDGWRVKQSPSPCRLLALLPLAS
jgi:hypothetical protein